MSNVSFFDASILYPYDTTGSMYKCNRCKVKTSLSGDRPEATIWCPKCEKRRKFKRVGEARYDKLSGNWVASA